MSLLLVSYDEVLILMTVSPTVQQHYNLNGNSLFNGDWAAVTKQLVKILSE